MSMNKGEYVRGSGEKGDSLFHILILNIVAKDIELLNERYTKHLILLREAKDERLQAIVGSLAVEDVLDSLLEAYIPKYNKYLKKNEDFTFSLKTELARSLKLIPTHLINAIDIIRQTRNEFAHNLDIQNFDALPERRKTDILKRAHNIHPEDNIDEPLSIIFGELVSSLLAIIGAYSTNVKVARDYIYSDDFYEVIREKAKNMKGDKDN